MQTATALSIVERYPLLVDAAFVIIGWVGFKLLIEWAHSSGYIGFEIPKWISLGLIVVIFGVAFVYARRQERRVRTAQQKAATRLLASEEGGRR